MFIALLHSQVSQYKMKMYAYHKVNGCEIYIYTICTTSDITSLYRKAQERQLHVEIPEPWDNQREFSQNGGKY